MTCSGSHSWRQHPHALVPTAARRCGMRWSGLAPCVAASSAVPIALLVDVTATGGAGLDPLRRAGFAPVGIVVHDGHAVEHADGLTWVPRLRLAAPLRGRCSRRRLTVSPALPDPERLRRALGAFRVPLGLEETTVAAGRDEADTGLVISLAVAVWAAEAGPRRPVAALAGAHRILWQRGHGGVYQA